MEKKRKVKRSYVHDYYEIVTISHPTKGEREGKECKICGTKVMSFNPTNLYNHLKNHHRAVHDKARMKDDELRLPLKGNTNEDEFITIFCQDNDEKEKHGNLKDPPIESAKLEYTNREEKFTSKKTRISRSSVHDHFNIVTISHPTKGEREGKECLICGAHVLCSNEKQYIYTTNLLSHLKNNHKDLYNVVKKKDDETRAREQGEVDDFLETISEESTKPSVDKKISPRHLWKKNLADHLSSGSRKDQSLDVRIKCGNGTIFTHKLVLASISSMLYVAMKNIISDDTCTILMPEFSVLEVGNIFSGEFIIDKLGAVDEGTNNIGESSVENYESCSDEVNNVLEDVTEHNDDLDNHETLDQTKLEVKLEEISEPIKIQFQTSSVEEPKDLSEKKEFFKQFISKHFIKVKEESGEFICNHCGKIFLLESLKTVKLRKHIMYVHQDLMNDIEKDSLLRFLKIPQKLSKTQENQFYEKMMFDHFTLLNPEEKEYQCRYCAYKQKKAGKSFPSNYFLQHLINSHPDKVTDNEKTKLNKWKSRMTKDDQEIKGVLKKKGYVHHLRGIKRKKILIAHERKGMDGKSKILHFRNYTWSCFKFAEGDESKVVCNICKVVLDYKPPSNYSQQVHIVQCHPEIIPDEERVNLMCSFCGKLHAKKGSKDRCERMCSNEKQYVCTYEGCGKRFSLKQVLVRHSRVHTRERPYQCNQCGVSFSQLSHLRTHERGVHLGEMPYQCSFCFQKFKWAACKDAHQKSCTLKT